MIESLSEEQKKAILEAIYARKKIEAIKLVREATNCGLKEAKEFVEKYSDELEVKEPAKFAPKGKGCSAVLVLMMALGALIIFAVK